MMCSIRKKGSSWRGTMIVIEDPLDESLTADIKVDNGNAVISLPKTQLINERGGISVDSRIDAFETFEKEESSYAPICYHMSSEAADIRIFKKGNKIFSFVELPILSNHPHYRGSDLLFIELDYLQE